MNPSTSSSLSPIQESHQIQWQQQKIIDAHVSAILEELGIADQVALFCERTFEKIKFASHPDTLDEISGVIDRFCGQVRSIVSPFLGEDIPSYIHIVGAELNILSMNPGTKKINLEASDRRRSSEKVFAEWEGILCGK